MATHDTHNTHVTMLLRFYASSRCFQRSQRLNGLTWSHTTLVARHLLELPALRLQLRLLGPKRRLKGPCQIVKSRGPFWAVLARVRAVASHR